MPDAAFILHKPECLARQQFEPYVLVQFYEQRPAPQCLIDAICGITENARTQQGGAFFMRVRLSISTCCILCALLVSGQAKAAQPKSEQEITESNWEHHPRIVEITKLYDDIQSKLESKALKYQEKNFTKLSRSCRGMYPVEYIGVATDHASRVRMYVRAQRISHDDLLTTRSYYDEGGHLRFVYKTNESPGFATIKKRIYLSEKGTVFWDVESEAKKLTFGKVTRSPSEIHKVTNAGVLHKFQSTEVKCEQHEDASQ